MKLLVRNLSRTTTEQEIREMFEQFGTVSECVLVLDQETGRSKGFGFVVMPDSTEANEAMEKLQKIRVAKNRIRVKPAQD